MVFLKYHQLQNAYYVLYADDANIIVTANSIELEEVYNLILSLYNRFSKTKMGTILEVERASSEL